MSDKSIELFFSYAHEDEELRDELAKHLAILQRQKVISTWYDRDISAGDEWKPEIEKRLNSADVILLLISANFLASDFCWGVELKRAMERHEAGEARVIPIIVREVDWKGAPFGKLQALPKNAEPVTNWANRDQAFADIARGIRRAVKDLRASASNPNQNSTFYMGERNFGWNFNSPRLRVSASPRLRVSASVYSFPHSFFRSPFLY
ncbi:MAG: toll/interleukin-1 receptor domain-containing protein [Symploca sp. SIO2E9]|nr:toll/interleukin-1 receptor domain-containing protein [Symploca sp. SIO2E9]